MNSGGFSLQSATLTVAVIFALAAVAAVIRIRMVEPISVKPFPNAKRPIVMAHRGGMALWPENTLYAFEHAARIGVDVMEIDVRQTKDGEIVVIHDEVVDRVSNGKGAVADKTLEELKSLDFAYNFMKDAGGKPELRGTGVTIGTLKEVFKSLPDMYFNIDIKVNSTAFARDVLELVRKEGMLEKVVIGSFYDNIVNVVNSEAGEFTTSAAAREAWIIFLLNKIGLGRLHQPTGVAYQIPVTHKGLDVVTPSFVRAAHSLGQDIHVWTIDDPVEIRRLLEMGVDGIVTNRPDLAVGVVKEFRQLAK
ncbi:MAG: glycerophosphodiester phosphodiesterase [Nitrospinota bacterium]